jgi:2-(1,2-epoxy-1,2-dihydrophenyl)acetyl-CoA isomerase
MTRVDYRLKSGAAYITLNDPARGNALDMDVVTQFHAAVHCARMDDARVVVIRGAGRSFCVGGDVRFFSEADDIDKAIEDLAELLHRTISDLLRMEAIVVTVVQGAVAGAGVALSAVGDVVLAAESARFTLAYTKLGLSPDGGSSMLSSSVGLHRALHLALMNPLLTADQAREAGLVGAVHPDADLDTAASQVVDVLLAGSRTAQVATKRLFRAAAISSPEGLLRQESLTIRTCAGAPDGLEGVDAFVAKRPADFPSNMIG